MGSSGSQSSSASFGFASTSANAPLRTGTAGSLDGKQFAPVFFWSLYAMVYDAIWDSPMTWLLAESANAAVPDAGTVIDLGCGTGLMARHRTAKVVGVDSSSAMLRRAAAHGRIGQAVLGPADQTPLPDGVADGLLLCNVLHLHSAPGDVLREAVRLCAPGGTLFVCWPIGNLDITALREIERRLGRPVLSRWLAHVLRSFIGTTAALTGTRSQASEAIMQAVTNQEGTDIISSTVLADCQHVVVLRRRATPSVMTLMHSNANGQHPPLRSDPKDLR